MDQASECDMESDEEPEDDKNVSEKSSQEVAGNNRELNFLISENTMGRIISTSFRAVLWQ